MDPAVDSRIKMLDAGMPLFHIGYEVRAVEHNSSVESCYDLFHIKTRYSVSLLSVSSQMT